MTREAKKILLVEDDLVFAQVLTRSLSRRGYQVLHVAQAKEVAEQALKFQPDKVILDLFLDGETGLSLLPMLRKGCPKAKILVLTGYASIATTVQAIKNGADNYLAKPANTNQILLAFTESADSSENDDLMNPLSIGRMEWEHIQKVLSDNQGNVSATARVLGMHRRTLQRKLAKKPKA